MPKASKRNAAQGVELGFDGKTLIHPNQIEPCNTAFSPSAAEVAWARKMIAEFDKPENKSKGVVSIDGRMVERLHAEMARRTVAIAEAIEARELEHRGVALEEGPFAGSVAGTIHVA